MKMPFPPAEKGFYDPAQFISHCNLLRGKIIAVGGNPVIGPLYFIANNPNRLFCLIGPGGTKKDRCVIEDDTSGSDFVVFQQFLFGLIFDAADKMPFFFLPLIEILVALIIAVHHTSLAGAEDLGDEGPFIPFPIGEEELTGYGMIQVET